MSSRKYSEEQLDILKKCYPISDYDSLFLAFPGKNKKQIKSLAHYYGIKNNNPSHLLDLVGKKFGLLTVIQFDHIENQKSYWECGCDCGNHIVASGQLLTHGNVKSCGCLKHTPRIRVNHVGEKHGKLTAVERIPNYKNGRTYYRCICDCGNVKYVLASNFVKGHTRSCGCAKRDLKAFWASVNHYRDDAKSVFCIYMHIAPNGKVYIGMTRQDAERRWQNGNGYSTQQLFYRAIQKYGWDSFSHKILESKLTEKEACEKEQYYIQKYKSNNPEYGYNATQGGDTSTNNVQPVMLYFKDEPVYFFESLADAANQLGVTSSAVRNYTLGDKQYGDYSFKKLPRIKIYDIPLEMYDIRNKTHLNVKNVIAKQFRIKTIERNKKGSIPISQYSLDGRYIRSFSSLAEAKQEFPYLSTTTVKGNGKSKSAYGFMWRYDTGDHSDISPITANKKYRKVIQIDSNTNEEINRFDSLADAERKTGVSSNQICKACNGLHKTSGGYKWMYEE